MRPLLNFTGSPSPQDLSMLVQHLAKLTELEPSLTDALAEAEARLIRYASRKESPEPQRLDAARLAAAAARTSLRDLRHTIREIREELRDHALRQQLRTPSMSIQLIRSNSSSAA